MYKKLVVVSDTALCKKDNQVFGFSAVVKELELLQNSFEEIIWIGTNQPELKNNGTLIEIKAPNIKTVLIPKMGGKSVMQILKIVFLYPYLFVVILKQIYKADVIHSRLPSHPAFIAVCISFLSPKKIWWNKFAGSWQPTVLPFFYKLQRGLLLKAKHTKVTINGFWNDQPQHCLSFENPCLTQEDLSKGKGVTATKTFQAPYVFAFVGRLDEAKGVSTIIQALKEIPITKIGKVHFIGNGPELQRYQSETQFLKEKVIFHGFQNSENVHALLAESHFFVLPSKAEGFPKVVAESACYGVIPIVSDVGSIPHYINQTNGFVWKREGEITFSQIVNNAVTTTPEKLSELSQQVQTMATLFTFENYKKKLEQLVLDKKK